MNQLAKSLAVMATWICLILTSVQARASAASYQKMAENAVDALVVLLADVSTSIDDKEYTMQIEGIATSLRNPELAYVVEKCSAQGIAISFVEFSGGESSSPSSAQQRLEWYKIRNGQDLRDFADAVENLKTRSRSGNTDLAGALQKAEATILASPFTSERKIISISSDGTQNTMGTIINGSDQEPSGEESHYRGVLRASRDARLKNGIIINGLVIQNDSWSTLQLQGNESLEKYFRDNVIGGEDSFVVSVTDFKEFADVESKALLRELNHCGM